jgi:hypothetical protein
MTKYTGQYTITELEAPHLAQRVAPMTQRQRARFLVQAADRLCLLEKMHLLDPAKLSGSQHTPASIAVGTATLERPPTKPEISEELFTNALFQFMPQEIDEDLDVANPLVQLVKK